jgi:ABC-type sugar transport system ATPase subunit
MALLHHTKDLIMDEPTSASLKGDSQPLWTIMRELRGRGILDRFIFTQLMKCGNHGRVDCLKDGENSGEVATLDTSTDDLVGIDVGRELDHFILAAHASRRTRSCLRRAKLCGPRKSKGLLQAAQGEIVGLAGAYRRGRTEVAALDVWV